MQGSVYSASHYSMRQVIVQYMLCVFNFPACVSIPTPVLRPSKQTYAYDHVNRTLCMPSTKDEDQQERKIFVDVSTLSTQKIQYQLRLSFVDNFTL